MRFLFFALFSFLLASSEAHAQAPTPKQTYEKGSKAFQQKKYDVALELFVKVYEETKDPNTLFNIAQCHRKLNDPKNAISYYEQFLKELPETSYRAEIEKLLTEERKKLPPEPPTITPTKEPASLVEPSNEPLSTTPPVSKEHASLLPFAAPGLFIVSAAATGSIALSMSQKFKREGFPAESGARTTGQILAIGCDVSLIATALSTLWAIKTYRKNAEELPR